MVLKDSVKQIHQALEYIMQADIESKGIGGYNKRMIQFLKNWF